jgi:hypothetical protein
VLWTKHTSVRTTGAVSPQIVKGMAKRERRSVPRFSKPSSRSNSFAKTLTDHGEVQILNQGPDDRCYRTRPQGLIDIGRKIGGYECCVDRIRDGGWKVAEFFLRELSFDLDALMLYCIRPLEIQLHR